LNFQTHVSCGAGARAFGDKHTSAQPGNPGRHNSSIQLI